MYKQSDKVIIAPDMAKNEICEYTVIARGEV